MIVLHEFCLNFEIGILKILTPSYVLFTFPDKGGCLNIIMIIVIIILKVMLRLQCNMICKIADHAKSMSNMFQQFHHDSHHHPHSHSDLQLFNRSEIL